MVEESVARYESPVRSRGKGFIKTAFQTVSRHTLISRKEVLSLLTP